MYNSITFEIRSAEDMMINFDFLSAHFKNSVYRQLSISSVSSVEES